MIAKIEEGSGVKMVLFIDGKLENFNLSILERRMFGSKKYEYGFVNDDRTKYTRGSYSGGNTGFGSSHIVPMDEDFAKDYKFITSDLECIQALANAEAVKEKLALEEEIANSEAKVIAVNKLPETFTCGMTELDGKYHFVRTKASYNRHMSRSIQGGGITFEKKTGAGSYWYDLDRYVNKIGVPNAKKFASEFGYADAKAAKFVLQSLIARRNELRNLVRNAK